MSETIETQRIRKEFFAYRNGIIADKLRRAGDPHAVTMGCLLVDLSDIARRFNAATPDSLQRLHTASALWQDTRSRECRLTAPMIYPPDLMDRDTAWQWCDSVESVEVADNLCHKLLRHIDNAQELMCRLLDDGRPLVQYTGYRLMLNLLLSGKINATPTLAATVRAAQAQAQPPLSRLLADILEELQGQ